MFESNPQQVPLQSPEQRPNDPIKALTAYADRTLLTPLRERANSRAMASNPAGRLEVNEDELISKEIAHFEQMRQEVQQGNFSGIAAELQARRSETEAKLAELRPQIRPRGEMKRDDEYFALKEEIVVGEKIREKVKGVLNEAELAWVAQSIEDRKRKQGGTPRGELMGGLNREKQTLDEITHLQQLISQPNQP